MGSFTNNWDNSKNGESLSQKVIDKVKPEAPLKNRIDYAQQKLQLQIVKLDSIGQKLQKKHDHVFRKIVDAQKLNNHSYAKAYAAELQEIRKMNNMVSNAKLSMEQIQIRLNTMSELGDVIVTLSPCMSIIRGLGATLGGIMPEANSSMQDLSNVLGDVLSGSSISNESTFQPRQDNADTLAILEEAHSVIESQAKANMPEPPSEIPTSRILERKEESI